MARMESKTIQVHAMEGQAATETMQGFGWSLLISHEVHISHQGRIRET